VSDNTRTCKRAAAFMFDSARTLQTSCIHYIAIPSIKTLRDRFKKNCFIHLKMFQQTSEQLN
jgi:hypothetical protein